MLKTLVFLILVILYGWLKVESPVPIVVAVIISSLLDQVSGDPELPMVYLLRLIALVCWLGLFTQTIPWALGFPVFLGCCFFGGALSRKKWRGG